MKKYVLFGILALALLAIPMAAAATETASMYVENAVDRSIDVTVNVPNAAFPNFQVGDNYMCPDANCPGGDNPILVTATVYGQDGPWTVKAHGEGPCGGVGLMQNDCISSLANPMKLKTDEASPGWFDLTSDYFPFMEGTTGGGASFTDHAWLYQKLLGTDPSGTYKITLTFIGHVG